MQNIQQIFKEYKPYTPHAPYLCNKPALIHNIMKDDNDFFCTDEFNYKTIYNHIFENIMYVLHLHDDDINVSFLSSSTIEHYLYKFLAHDNVSYLEVFPKIQESIGMVLIQRICQQFEIQIPIIEESS